jgi:hypothetical protein
MEILVGDGLTVNFDGLVSTFSIDRQPGSIGGNFVKTGLSRSIGKKLAFFRAIAEQTAIPADSQT